MTLPDAKGTSQHDLAARWRAEIDVLRKRGAEAVAAAVESCADELEQSLREAALEALTLSEAAEESGYSKSHLSRLIATDRLPNAGRRNAPRVKRGDLPRKPDNPMDDGPDLVGQIHGDIA